MVFHDVEFLPTRANFSTAFHKNCVIGDSLGSTTCHKTAVGLSKGMLPVKYLRSNNAFFASIKFHGDHKTVTSHSPVSVIFHGDHKTVTMMRQNLTTFSFWDITRLK